MARKTLKERREQSQDQGKSMDIGEIMDAVKEEEKQEKKSGNSFTGNIVKGFQQVHENVDKEAAGAVIGEAQDRAEQKQSDLSISEQLDIQSKALDNLERVQKLQKENYETLQQYEKDYSDYQAAREQKAAQAQKLKNNGRLRLPGGLYADQIPDVNPGGPKLPGSGDAVLKAYQQAGQVKQNDAELEMDGFGLG